jgi:predicted amidohydrolase
MDDEKTFFRPGDVCAVVDTAHGRIGVLVCYDRARVCSTTAVPSWRALAQS